MMKILIGADFGPTKSNEDFFVRGDMTSLMGEALVRIISEADYSMFNLECPLTDHKTPIAKNGSNANFMAPTDAAVGYKMLNINLLCLANNHIMDQAEQGLFSTIDTLSKQGIGYIGAGKNLQEAMTPRIFECEEKKIGVYACAEHEFSIAKESKPGANPFDSLDSPDHVAALKKQCDYVIVLYHGGKEYYRYPSPGLQKTCRKLVEKGADLVICQHSHCIGCKEEYLQGTIVYGQGNFLFDKSDEDCWLTGLLVQIEDDYQIRYIPVVKNGEFARLAEHDEAQQILSEFEQRSEQIKNTGFIEERYQKFAGEMLEFYLRSFMGHRGVLQRALNKLSGYRLGPYILKKKYREFELLNFKNLLECESHREIIMQGCEEGVKKLKRGGK